MIFSLGVVLLIVGVVIFLLWGGTWWRCYWSATHSKDSRHVENIAMAECQGGVEKLRHKAILWGLIGVLFVIAGIACAF